MANMKDRKIWDFNKVPLLKIYLDLFSYVTDLSWIVPYAKDIQRLHGSPFISGTLMDDNEIIDIGLDERVYHSSESLAVEDLRANRVVLLSDFRMAGISLMRHSSRVGTWLVDLMMMKVGPALSRSNIKQSDIQKVVMALQMMLFSIGYLHDIGKLSKKLRSKDDIFYIYSLPRQICEAERRILPGHTYQENIYETWQEVFRTDPGTVHRIITLSEEYHQKDRNGCGYPKKDFPSGLSLAEEWILKILPIVDKAEAGTSLDRIFRNPKKPSALIRELNKAAEDGLISKSATELTSSMLVDNGGLANIDKLTKIVDIERTLREHFRKRSITFESALNILSVLLEESSTSIKTEAKNILNEL